MDNLTYFVLLGAPDELSGKTDGFGIVDLIPNSCRVSINVHYITDAEPSGKFSEKFKSY